MQKQAKTKKKLRWILAAGAVVALLAIGSCYHLIRENTNFVGKAEFASAPKDKNLPDIVVLVIDTLRYDAILKRDGRPKSSPFANFANAGRVYSNAYATAGWTLPTHVSMVSGLLPIKHRTDQENWEMGEHFPVFPELLAAKGYFNAGISENPYLSRFSGFPRGFHEYDQAFNPKNGRTELLVRDIVRKREAKRRPLFLFVNIMDTHKPYTPTAQYFKKDRAGMSYDEAIALDERLSSFNYYMELTKPPTKSEWKTLRYLYNLEMIEAGQKAVQILQTIKRHRKRPLYVFLLADHGEHFGEHGHMGHRFSLYQPLIHVPLIIIGPEFAQGVDDSPVSQVDLFPTILRIAGIAAPPNDGRDLIEGGIEPGRPLFSSASYPEQSTRMYPDDRKHLVDKYLSPIFAIRRENWKLLEPKKGELELYDIAADPFEKKSLVEPTEQVKTLSRMLEGYRGQQWPVNKAKNIRKPDRATEESLRSLGYIQ